MFDFFGIYWAETNNLLLLPIFLIAIYFIFKNYIKIKTSKQQLVHKKNQKFILQNFSERIFFIKNILLSLSLVCIFLAILRPQFGKKEIKVMQEGRDLLIALDISKSMLAKDLKPTRLEFTKLKIRNLLKKLDFERVGLILFSGSAFLQCPLTVDHSAFLMFLDQIDVETIASGTTAVDSAILKATEIFNTAQKRKNKLLLIATDGEDFSLNLDYVKQKASDMNLKIFALGVGTTQGAPIPIIDENGIQKGHETNTQGQIVLSKLNEKFLENICEKLNGNYFKSTYDDSDLNQIASKIKGFDKEKFEDRKMSYYQDQYPWLLGFSFLLLLLEWIL